MVRREIGEPAARPSAEGILARGAVLGGSFGVNETGGTGTQVGRAPVGIPPPTPTGIPESGGAGDCAGAGNDLPIGLLTMDVW
ncbi:MAG TPA: hypothetical protein VNE21_07010 [Mycobacteriales bacterium]|nr:hypothetical protein [Mycobacteriales bacterium]